MCGIHCKRFRAQSAVIHQTCSSSSHHAKPSHQGDISTTHAILVNSLLKLAPDMLLCCYMCKGGKGAYAAFDAVGGKQAMDVVKALRRGGVCQVYGLLEPGPLQVNK